MPLPADFQPRYILDGELATYGLPTIGQMPTIMNLVDAASTLIDEHCGRTDGTGFGSLVYSTYVERLLMGAEQRNIIRTMYRPLVAVDTTVQASLTGIQGVSGNHFYTGFTPNSIVRGSTLSPLIGASGRYGYGRRNSQFSYPDYNYGANILQIASYFGGPPQFTPIDISMVDFDPSTGELWVPAGLYLTQYSELLLTYNTGFDPTNMPKGIKHACAALVKNFLSRSGITGLTSMNAGQAHAQFNLDLIDPTVARLLQPFCTVVGY